MRTGEDGTVHPTVNDAPTPDGWLHIAGCLECQATLGPAVQHYAQVEAAKARTADCQPEVLVLDKGVALRWTVEAKQVVVSMPRNAKARDIAANLRAVASSIEAQL